MSYHHCKLIASGVERLGTDPEYDCEPLRRWLCAEAASGTIYTVKVK